VGTAKPTVLSNKDAFQFERIAALRPDLIGTNAGIKRADYRKLSAIAPTIAGVVGGTDYFSRGTSRPCSSPARWARRPRAAPWSSLSRRPEHGVPHLPRLPDQPQGHRAGQAPGEQVPISAEQLPILESDVIVFATEEAKDVPALMKVKLFPRIPAVAGNRAVYTDATLSGAMYFVSPLSLPYVLDKLVPQLEAALDGRAPRSIGSSG
jgi:iron complex transport system substrate-binding protein